MFYRPQQAKFLLYYITNGLTGCDAQIISLISEELMAVPICQKHRLMNINRGASLLPPK
jgi:hypothetical protein